MPALLYKIKIDLLSHLNMLHKASLVTGIGISVSLFFVKHWLITNYKI